MPRRSSSDQLTMPRAQERRDRASVLPPTLPPRGLSRAEAAAYIGVGPTLFDEMVRDGRMPAAKRINSRLVWDRNKLDSAFDALPDTASLVDPWERVAV